MTARTDAVEQAGRFVSDAVAVEIVDAVWPLAQAAVLREAAVELPCRPGSLQPIREGWRIGFKDGTAAAVQWLHAEADRIEQEAQR